VCPQSRVANITTTGYDFFVPWLQLLVLVLHGSDGTDSFAEYGMLHLNVLLWEKSGE
jgi:hypothetical protein